MSQRHQYSHIEEEAVAQTSANVCRSKKVSSMDNAPPGYDDVKEADVEAALLDKLEETYGSITFFGFIRTFLVLFVGSIGFLLMVVLFVGIPPSMIVMGSLYLNSCPAQPYIPIYLIVGGCFSMCSFLLGIIVRLRYKKEELEEKPKRHDVAFIGIANLVHCITISWFLAGCTWVYGIYKPSFDNSASIYCDKTVYLFSFWLLNSIFIVIGSLLLLGLFMLICSVIGVRQKLIE